jgi:hypothetical protein
VIPKEWSFILRLSLNRLIVLTPKANTQTHQSHRMFLTSSWQYPRNATTITEWLSEVLFVVPKTKGARYSGSFGMATVKRKKYIVAKWSVVCRPKDQRGLGI